MMESLLGKFFGTGTGRRVVVLVVSSLVVILNRRLGLGLDAQEVAELVYLAIAYIAAGNVRGAAEALAAFFTQRQIRPSIGEGAGQGAGSSPASPPGPVVR